MKNIFFISAHTIRVLTARDVLSAIKGWGPYIAATISFLVSSFLIKNYLATLKENDILISSDPLNFPLMVSLIVVSIYLAIFSTVSVSREKDQGTLEVLFYGPVSCWSFLLAKYLADILIFLFVVGFLVLYFLALTMLTNLGLSWNLVEAIVLSIFSASCVISFSMFISSFTSKTRSSIIWLVTILFILLAIEVSHSMLLRLPEESLSDLLIYLREGLRIAIMGTEWISPFSILMKGMESIGLGSFGLYALNVLHAVVYTFLFLILSKQVSLSLSI
jgi:ABC-type transport system involved in multi-copper enzyme maturation permease subunit